MAVMIDPKSIIKRKTENQLSAYFDTRDRVRWTSSLKRLTEEAAQEYEDRFLIELIQNAYDAHTPGSTDGRIEILLDFSEGDYGTVYVANTGRPFREPNFEAITDIAQSDKPPGEGIGNKGVGFKSVLQVAEWPEIYSTHPDREDSQTFDGFCFRFATPSDVEGLVPVSDLAQAVLSDVSPYLLPVPIEEVPSSLNPFKEDRYCTAIRLPLRSSKAAARAEDEVRKLATADTPVLLFLDRISNLHLSIRDTDGSLLHETDLFRHPTVILPPSDGGLCVTEVNLGAQGTFLVLSQPLDREQLKTAIELSIAERQIDPRWREWKQEASVSVAVKFGGNDDPWRLYTFLPMDNSPSPFAAHANAPFFTKLARSSVSFGVGLNDFLLEEIAHLCVTAALWIRDADEGYAPLCLDLIAWDRDYLERLRAAFGARGLQLETAQLVPIIPRDGKQFGAVQTVRRWDKFTSPLAFLGAERLSAQTSAELIDPSLGPRLDRFSRLRDAMRLGDSGRPSPTEAADWCEAVAAALHQSTSAESMGDWMALYEDLAIVFSVTPRSLAGRYLILDHKDQLQPFLGGGTEKVSPTVFFWPVQDRTEGEEDVETSLDLSPPRALARNISFTHPGLEWYTQEGPRRTARRCRQFFEAAGLVRRYRTQDVLEAVGRILASRRTEAVMREALFFVFRLRDRTSGKPALNELGLHVPTMTGWVPARSAIFSESWPRTKGSSLGQLIKTTGATSSSMAALEDRFLRPPDEWLPIRQSVEDWTAFLRRLGVRDGLWPITAGRTPFRQYGASFTPEAWGRAAKLNEIFIQKWKSDVPQPGGFQVHPQTVYTSVGQLWALPGQFEHAGFPNQVKYQYATLVIANLSTWHDRFLTVGVRRESYPGEEPSKWPTPLAVFLQRYAWIPVRFPDEQDPVAVKPGEAWLFDDDQPDTPPPFAPLVPRAVRRLLERDEHARRLLRTLGVRTWNDRRDAVHLVHRLYELHRDGRVPLSQIALYRRQYEQAMENTLAQGQNPWAGRSDIELVVRRGQRIETLASGESPEIIYVDDGSDSLTMRIISDLDAPILCARSADGARLADYLSLSLGDQVRRMSEVEVEVAVDRKDLSEVSNAFKLVEADREWLVDLIVAALEFKGSEFRRQTERTLREAARRIHNIHVVPAGELQISVDGQPVIDPAALRGVFAIGNETTPMIVVQDFPGEFTWLVLERIATPLSQLLRNPEAGPVIFEAIVRLGRRQGGTVATPPTQAELAEALGITVAQLQEARQLLQSSIEILAERLYVVLGYMVSPTTALAALPELDRASTEEMLVSILQAAGISAAEKVILATKRASNLRELREELGFGYREFNDALRALDMQPLTDPAGQQQALDYFIAMHRNAILTRLRAAYMADFVAGHDVTQYVTLRRLPDLNPPPDWLEECELPTDPMLSDYVDAWLAIHGAPDLSASVDEYPVDEMRASNRKVVTSWGSHAARSVRAWCLKKDMACPALWSGEGQGGQLADWADDRGLLDFVRITDLTPLLVHLERSDAWPPDMPPTIDLGELGLSVSDLERGDTEEEKQRRQRDLERKTIVFGAQRLSTEPERFPEIAEAVRENLKPQLLKTPLRLANLAPAPPGKPSSRSKRDSHSYYRGHSRPSDQQLAAIGLVGELIAHDWLVEQYQGDVVEWRSGYRDKVLGGSEGNDKLGYDFEVITRANTFLFEVKSSVDDAPDFELAESEVNAARLHIGRDAYRIIYVRNVLEMDRTSILLLPNPFTRRGQETYRITGSGLHYRFATNS